MNWISRSEVLPAHTVFGLMIMLAKGAQAISQVTDDMNSCQETFASNNLASKDAFLYVDEHIIAS